MCIMYYRVVTQYINYYMDSKKNRNFRVVNRLSRNPSLKLF